MGLRAPLLSFLLHLILGCPRHGGLTVVVQWNRGNSQRVWGFPHCSVNRVGSVRTSHCQYRSWPPPPTPGKHIWSLWKFVLRIHYHRAILHYLTSVNSRKYDFHLSQRKKITGLIISALREQLEKWYPAKKTGAED